MASSFVVIAEEMGRILPRKQTKIRATLKSGLPLDGMQVGGDAE
jgi:hypothetical protein